MVMLTGHRDLTIALNWPQTKEDQVRVELVDRNSVLVTQTGHLFLGLVS